jgi:glutaredoxin
MYIIFGRESCWYCKNAQSKLTNKKQKYRFYNIDSDKYREYSSFIPEDFSTVPKIIKETPKNKKFIGGFDSLVLYLRNLKKTKKKTKRKTKTKKKYNRK